MGLKTELAIDDDRCKQCGAELAIEGMVIDQHEVISNGIVIAYYGVLCQRCFAIDEIPYYGELLPSERMKRQCTSGNEYPRQPCVHVVW